MTRKPTSTGESMKLKNEQAVSPVIGVLLMVAITVILAAVIAAFVFGMAGSISKTKVVAITMEQVNSTHISLTNNGGQDVSDLISINVTGQITLLPQSLAPHVGATKNYELEGGAGQKHIVVVGLFKDGTEQVLLDKYAIRA